MNPKALRAYPPRILDRSPQRRAEATLAELTRDAYPDPLFSDSAESFARHHHDDIARMDLDTLDRERLRARFRWAYDAKPSEWLCERIARLDAESERRRQGPVRR